MNDSKETHCNNDMFIPEFPEFLNGNIGQALNFSTLHKNKKQRLEVMIYEANNKKTVHAKLS